MLDKPIQKAGSYLKDITGPYEYRMNGDPAIEIRLPYPLNRKPKCKNTLRVLYMVNGKPRFFRVLELKDKDGDGVIDLGVVDLDMFKVEMR